MSLRDANKEFNSNPSVLGVTLYSLKCPASCYSCPPIHAMTGAEWTDTVECDCYEGVVWILNVVGRERESGVRNLGCDRELCAVICG